MRFLGIRLAQGRLSPSRAFKRLIGLGLAVVTLGLGFLGIVFGERRRGLEDRLGETDVVYDERRPDPAPWSQPPAGVPVEPTAAAAVAADPVSIAESAPVDPTPPAPVV
jgi:hypothetical protein